MSESIHDAIRREVAGWPGVEALPHRFGGTEFRLGKVELGHLHGNRLADLPFPKKISAQLIADGRAAHHHVLPDSGWVSCWISGPEEVPQVVELFRMNYDRYSKKTRPYGVEGPSGA